MRGSVDVRRDAIAGGMLVRSVAPNKGTLILRCEDGDDFVREHLVTFCVCIERYFCFAS